MNSLWQYEYKQSTWLLHLVWSMYHVAGIVAGWCSLHERLIFQTVSKNISPQLEEELEHEVWDSLDSLSLELDTANRNTWNDLLYFVTHCDFVNRIQANLEDEEVGRVGLSCHYALDWLCAELHTFWHPGYSSAPIEWCPEPTYGRSVGCAGLADSGALLSSEWEQCCFDSVVALAWFYVRYPWTAWEDVICALASPRAPDVGGCGGGGAGATAAHAAVCISRSWVR